MKAQILVVASSLLFALGCQDTVSVREELIPRGQNGGHGEPGICQEERDIFDYIDRGTESWFYGTIEKVEGFTDRYWTRNEAHEDVYSAERCGNMTEISVVVHIRPEHTSWNSDGELSVIRVGLPHNDFTQKNIKVELARDDKGIVWEDGNVRYFPTGARIGVAGSFDDEGTFRSWTSQIFGVSSDGIIEGYKGLGCVNGSLNGVAVDEILERAHNVTKGMPMTYSEHTPFASHCFYYGYEEDER